MINNYLKGKSPERFDLLFWNADVTNLPGPMYCWYIRNMYLENNLRQPNRLMVCNTPVDLRRVDLPAYVLATVEDHIVPWRSAYRTTGLFSGDIRFVLGASGHIAGVINPASKNKRSYWVSDNRCEDPAAWCFLWGHRDAEIPHAALCASIASFHIGDVWQLRAGQRSRSVARWQQR